MTQPPYPDYPQNDGDNNSQQNGASDQGAAGNQPPAPDYGSPSNQPPAPDYSQQAYPSGPQPAGSYPSGGASSPRPSQNAVETKGFFGALFDFSFRSFVAIKFTSFIYVLLLVFLALGWLFGLIGSFVASPIAGVLFLIFGTIGTLIYLVLIRVGLEVLIAVVRTSQNTAATQTEVESLRWDLSQRG